MFSFEEKTPCTFFLSRSNEERVMTELFGLLARVCGRAGKNLEEKITEAKHLAREIITG